LGSVLFDLDGTLTDPKVGITRCIQHALAALGRAVPPEQDLLWCIGPPLQASFPQLLATRDPALIHAAIAHYRERFTTVGLYENKLYPGVPEMLAGIKAKGHRIFLATSKPHVFARRILEHFQAATLFDGIHGSELDGTRADKGQLITHLLAVEGLAAESAIMVGDREHDMLGGRACGLRCIGVTYGYGSEAELWRSGAARLAADPAQVVMAVAALFAEGERPPC
jgi:phosphoglycolate phosphatase